MSAILPDPERVHYFPSAGSPITLSGMDSRDLMKAQAEVLLARIWPMLNYLNRLKQRMERRRFPPQPGGYKLLLAVNTSMPVDSSQQCRCSVGRSVRQRYSLSPLS